MKKLFLCFAITLAVLAFLHHIVIKLAKMYDDDMDTARDDEIRNIAIKLKKYGDSASKIAEITGLSIGEIDTL